MRKYTNTSIIVMLLGLAILWAGCAGPTTEKAGPTEGAAGTILVTTGAVEPTGVAVPDWFLNIPEDPNFMYSVGTGTSEDMQGSLDDARLAARVEIGSQVETKVAGLFKRFREETGTGEDSELLAMSASVTKAIVAESVKGSKTVKQAINKEGKKYHAYILMELSLGAMNTAALEKVKANENMYTRFRASQGFKELEDEVEKYDKWRKEQEQPVTPK